MDFKELFIKYMSDTTNIALATQQDGKANLRIVSIGYDTEKPNTVYFTTSKTSNKALEIASNPAVAFVPAPDKKDTDVTIRVYGSAKASERPLSEVGQLIGKHLPEFAGQIPAMADFISVYEITFESAEVCLGMTPPTIVTF